MAKCHNWTALLISVKFHRYIHSVYSIGIDYRVYMILSIEWQFSVWQLYRNIVNVTYRLHGAEERKYEIRYPYRITIIIIIIKKQQQYNLHIVK